MIIFSSILSRTLSRCSGVRAPLIRFRYGASRDQKATPASGSPSAAGGSSKAPQSGEPIYDFQLPQKWRRRPLSEEEIAYINRGGPE